MAKKIKMLPIKNIKLKSGDMTLNLDLSRFEKQFQQAQYLLDSTVMTDMQPFMPMDKSTFINKTLAESAAMAGTGQVCAAKAPEGRFLYYGKTMVDEETGSPFARKGARKVLLSEYGGKSALSESLKEDLQYSTHAHPKAQSRWFEAAKEQHGDHWVSMVKKIAGGGSGGV